MTLVENDKTHYHFIGIGGAGMSAIASVLLDMGCRVTGSDLKESRYTKALAKRGASVHIGHHPDNVRGAEMIVISSAIDVRNSELVFARQLGVPVLKRGELLADLARRRRTIAVGGTHGKTTTTSMIALLLDAAGLDPSFVIGGELNDTGTNARYGRGDILVAEGDESDGSLLYLSPAVGVVTNVEADHVDYYRSIDQIEDCFRRFLAQASELAVVWGDDGRLMRLTKEAGVPTLTYGLSPGCDVRAEEIALTAGGCEFDLVAEGSTLGRVKLAVPGEHNVINALSAVTVGLHLGIDAKLACETLSGFTGVHRRFERLGQFEGVTVIDDYAHHPTEVSATLAAARQGDWSRVVVLFQPHRYSRLQYFFRELAEALADADVVMVTDIYASGEEPIPGVTGKLLTDELAARNPSGPAFYLPRRTEILPFLRSYLKAGDVLLTMGAGDVCVIGEELLNSYDGDSGDVALLEAPVGGGGVASR